MSFDKLHHSQREEFGLGYMSLNYVALLLSSVVAYIPFRRFRCLHVSKITLNMITLSWSLE